MILPIYTYGQAVLRLSAKDISADYPGLSKLIADMFETMVASDGVGLAAPQIGLSIRLVVVTLDPLKDEYPHYAGFNRTLINPHIVEADHCAVETIDEGCLSLPGVRERVSRPTRVRVKYLDENFQPRDEWVDGYFARVVQHEVDHLEGIVFTDRISPMRKQIVRKRLQAIQRGRVRCPYRILACK